MRARKAEARMKNLEEPSVFDNDLCVEICKASHPASGPPGGIPGPELGAQGKRERPESSSSDPAKKKQKKRI